MATHVVTATTTSPTPSGNQFSVYGQPSPVNSATATPSNNSPTSPRQQYLPLNNRQLRPPKAPLYVPAALRPTERPQKHSPPTPPRSVHGSLDSLNDGEEQTIRSRRSTMDSTTSGGVSRLAENEWMRHEHLGQVTGLPTRDHWKADAASPNCDSPTCRSSFGIFLRRHHCRHCGHVFCSSHTPFNVPLDQSARFHPDGVPSRACDLCWHAYKRWEESRSDRLNKIQGAIDEQHSSSSGSDRDPSETQESSPVEGPRAKLAAMLGPNPNEIAASVPRGWNWSTF